MTSLNLCRIFYHGSGQISMAVIGIAGYYLLQWIEKREGNDQ
jgi:hypothetical protein